MAEEVVKELGDFAGIDDFIGHSVGFQEGIVFAVVVHIPSVEVMQGDVIAEWNVFKSLGEGELEVEGCALGHHHSWGQRLPHRC